MKLGLTPDEVASMVSVNNGKMTLDIDQKDLATLDGFVVPDFVERLLLNHNRLPSLRGLEHAINLTILSANYNRLTTLGGIEYLTNLRLLDVHYNELSSLRGIEVLTKLICLNAWGNQLSSLHGIEALTNLTTVDVQSNQLTSLNGIGPLVNLERLWCGNNQLTSLNGIERLVNLESLWCNINQLKELPIEVTRSDRLEDGYFDDNPWIFPPRHVVVSVGWQSIRGYFETHNEYASLRSIRSRATEICVALHALHLPALQTIMIIDAAVPNALDTRFGAKWDLVCAVKHFHQRVANIYGTASVP